MQREEWHLDKKVPIGIITALFFQTLFFTYIGTAWKVDVESRLGALERSDSVQSTHETRITVIEQGINRIREDLAEIKVILRGRQSGSLDDAQQPQQ